MDRREPYAGAAAAFLPVLDGRSAKKAPMTTYRGPSPSRKPSGACAQASGVAAFLLAGALLAGCSMPAESHRAGQPARVATQTSTPAEFAGTRWVVERIDGRPVLPATRITLDFEPKRVGGFDGCNWFGGSYAKSRSFGLTEIVSTAIGCADPVLEQSRRLGGALMGIDTATRAGDRLTLADSSGRTRLELSVRPDRGPQGANLANTRWRLKAVNGRPVSGRPIQLDFAARTFALSIDCGLMTGDYLVQHDRVHFPQRGMDYGGCQGGMNGPGVSPVSMANVAALESPEAVYVEGDQLMIEGTNHRRAEFERCDACVPLRIPQG